MKKGNSTEFLVRNKIGRISSKRQAELAIDEQKLAIIEYVEKMRDVRQKDIYRDICFKMGRKYARVYHVLSNGQKSACQFVDPITGNIYRANSWKQRGRLIGNIKTIWGEEK